MGSIRKIFGRAIATASSPTNGQILRADSTQVSGVKWDNETSFDLPAAASAGQVLKATGTGVGDYTWGVDNDTIFSLPAPASAGQVLEATGTGVGDYTWSTVDSIRGVLQVTSTGSIVVPTGATKCLAIGKGGDSAGGNVGLNVALGGVAASISTVSTVTSGSSMSCVVGGTGTPGNSGGDSTFNSLSFPGAGYSIVSGTAFQGGAFTSPTAGFLTLVFY